MDVHIVDPSAWTLPYDHSLCEALADQGLEVELVTGPHAYGRPRLGNGYGVVPLFYPLTARLAPRRERVRKALQVLEHVPGMVRYRSRAENADVVHYQWFVIEHLDMFLVPSKRPRVLTAHNVLPRDGRIGQTRAAIRLLREMDAVVVHSRHGARRLAASAGVDVDRIHVIPHGALDYLTRLSEEEALPAEFQSATGVVVLCFGMIRHHKGVDVLLEAFRSVAGAELWIVGVPLIRLDPLLAAARQAAGRVRFHPQFVPESAVPAFFRRADVVVLPHREIDQSGVLYAALAFGKPVVATDVGGFPEVIREHRFGLLARAGDSGTLAGALNRIVADAALRRRLGEAARRAAREHYSWTAIAEQTIALYRKLLDAPGQP